MSGAPAPVRRASRTLFVLTLGVYLFTAGASLTTTDAVVAFDVTRSLVEHGSVAMSGNLLGMEAHRGRDGRYYAPFGLGQSIYNVPFYLAGRTLVTATGIRLGKPDTVPKAIVALGATVVVAAIAVAMFRLALLLTGNLPASLGGSLALAFGSVLWPYARFGFNQPLAALALIAAVGCAIHGVRTNDRRSIALAGVWIAAGLMTRHEVLLAAAPLAIWMVLDRPVSPRPSTKAALGAASRLGAFAPGVMAGVALWLAYNYARFGHPLDSGYLRDPTPGFGSPIGAGVLALLFSPGASLLLYSPIVVVGLAGLARRWSRGDRSTTLLLLSLPAIFLLFYATLGNWIGGRSYGSRYLVLILPLFAPGVAEAIDWARARPAARLALIGAIVASTLVQLPGVVVDYAKVSQAAAARQGAFTTEERQWRWAASSLVLNTEAAWTAVPANLAYLTGTRTPPPIAPPSGDADRGFSQQFSFSLDFWWLYLVYLKSLPLAAPYLLIAGFLLFVGLCVRRLRAISAAT